MAEVSVDIKGVSRPDLEEREAQGWASQQHVPIQVTFIRPVTPSAIPITSNANAESYTRSGTSSRSRNPSLNARQFKNLGSYSTS